MLKRFLTREVQIGSTAIGGKNPIRLQTMLTVPVTETKAAFEQALGLIEKGAELLRLAIPGLNEARALEKLKNLFLQKKIKVPLIADIHFFPKTALLAADFADKIRINPGNFLDPRAVFQKKLYSKKEYGFELERLEEGFCPLLAKLKKQKKALRLGVNHGSLSDRILSRFGNTVEGMLASAFEYAEIARKHHFHDLVFSLKASSPLLMIKANLELVRVMQKKDWDYPVHLGVTEAGEGKTGRVKSALGIGFLLFEGIGDTIRLSLTEDPQNELLPARILRDFTQKKSVRSRLAEELKRPKRFSSSGIILSLNQKELKTLTPKQLERTDFVFCPSPNPRLKKKHPDGSFLNSKLTPLIKAKTLSFQAVRPLKFQGSQEKILLEASAFVGVLLVKGLISRICLKVPLAINEKLELSENLLQAAQKKVFKTEFISCPGCGRTLFDLSFLTREIKAKTAHLPGLKIAVMGCVVNGPGEMGEADFGVIGAAPDEVHLYRGQTCVQKKIKTAAAADALIELIKTDGLWQDF
ncbi:MAG: (E)-4-hydroxy-3-methylbut-2-enyl-diphosphate synthase [Parachlamydiales bacterium]|jgi:(E)-4-hydroxy-3-methylbut-2-enyl-diphosphate synthase